MADTAKAHDTDTYRARLRRAQAEMSKQGVDYLFVTPSSDLTYLLGYPAHASERMTLLGVPREGEPFVVAPTLEATRLDNRRDIVDVHAWNETESPAELTARLLEHKGGAIAISDQTWSIFLLRLQEAIPDARFQSGTGILRELRMTKDAAELDALRDAGRRADRVWEKFIESARMAGRTERDVANEVNELMRAEGLDPAGFLIVASGPGSASPHYMTSERVIQNGDSIVFDFGSTLEHRYWCDITRTLHVGEPSAEYRKVYDIVLAANRAARAAVKPGVTCQEIDRAARKVIDDAGYGEYFIHRLGHGLGLDGHEEPYMVEGNTLPLAPGMVFSDEPGIYIPGKFGVRIEDILVCTEDGAESLNDAPRELVVVD
jgi:Xaa-Pro aminopeptidase